jgi:hypothetical protein
VNISFVPPKHINDVWDTLEKILAPAVVLTNGRYLVEDIRAAAKLGDVQLWIAFNDEHDIIGCAVTSISDYPSRRLLTVLFLAGIDFRLWRDEIIQTLSSWGRNNKCSGLEAYGRRGWVKMLESHGIKWGLTMMEKDI